MQWRSAGPGKNRLAAVNRRADGGGFIWALKNKRCGELPWQMILVGCGRVGCLSFCEFGFPVKWNVCNFVDLALRPNGAILPCGSGFANESSMGCPWGLMADEMMKSLKRCINENFAFIYAAFFNDAVI